MVFIYSIYHWPFPIKIEMLRNYICFTDLLIHINIVFGFRIIWNRVLKSITFDLEMPSDDIQNVPPLSHVSFWRVPSYTMYSYCFLSEIGRRRLLALTISRSEGKQLILAKSTWTYIHAIGLIHRTVVLVLVSLFSIALTTKYPHQSEYSHFMAVVL